MNPFKVEQEDTRKIGRSRALVTGAGYGTKLASNDTPHKSSTSLSRLAAGDGGMRLLCGVPMT